MKQDITIIRRNDIEGTSAHMTLIMPGNEKQEIAVDKLPGYLYVHKIFQCVDRFVVLSIGGEPYTLKAGDKLVFKVRQDDDVPIFCMGDGAVSLLCIYGNEEDAPLEITTDEVLGNMQRYASETGAGYNEEKRENISTEKTAKTTMRSSFASDIGLAYKIALTRFRGSSIIVRSLRAVWYDRALQRGIDRIEKAYLPYILIIIGLMVIGLSGAGKISNNVLFILMGAWVGLAVFVIVPFIFYAALPKPIAPHIKRIDNLSAEERDLYEEDLRENKRVNKIIDRYTMPKKGQ